jgi:hypothetical protein
LKPSKRQSGVCAGRTRTARLYGGKAWTEIAPGVWVKVMSITIRGRETFYVVQRMAPDKSFGKWSLRLWKMGKGPCERYDLAAGEWGLECSCGDFHYRRQNYPVPCKHALSCIAVGLLRKRQ